MDADPENGRRSIKMISMFVPFIGFTNPIINNKKFGKK